MGNLTRIGERGVAYRVVVGNIRDGDHLEDIRVNVRIILKMILKKRIGGSGLD